MRSLETGRIVAPEGSPIVDVPSDALRLPMPVYKDTDGTVKRITGVHADSWPSPRVLYSSDGSMFQEVPLPSIDGWGLTYHAVRPCRSRLGVFIAQYVEGRESGFPLIPVLVFSWRSARRRRMPMIRRGSA